MKAIETQRENKKRDKWYDDGFRYAENEEYVVWHPEEGDKQNIYYLHGALHLFDAGSEIKKYTWVNTGISLLKQVEKELKQDNFPLFVAEGTSKEKLTRINHSQYLGKGIRSFAKIGGSLFIFGHSLADNDSHYVDLISKNKVKKLFVSLLDGSSDELIKKNRDIVRKAENLITKRLTEDRSKPLEVHYFDAKSAKVWG